MLSWGIALMCNAAVKNKGGLYTTRFLLGVVSYRPNKSHYFRIKHTNLQQAEAGQFPGVILQMTYWYRPDEMSLRLLYFCKLHKICSQIDSRCMKPCLQLI